MKKLISGLFVLGAALVAFSFWNSKSRPAEAEGATDTTVIEAQKIDQKLKVKELKNQAIAKVDLGEVKVQAGVPAVCQQQWEKMATFSATQIYDDLDRGQLTLSEECLTFETSLKSEDVKKLYALCKPDPNERKILDRENCQKQLLLYRGLWIAQLTADRKDYRTMPFSMLMHKFMAPLLSQNFTPENIAELGLMAEAMIERDPHLLYGHKALAMTKIMGDEQRNPQMWNDLSRAVDGALAVDPTDSQLKELKLLSQVKTGNTDALNGFVQSNPSSAIGYYYRAYAFFKAGDRGSSISNVRTAIQIDSKDQRFPQTLAKLEQGQTEDVFSVTAGVTFSEE